MVFGNYRKVVFLSQTGDPRAADDAQRAAEYLGLPLETVRTGYGDLQASLARAVGGARGARVG